MRVDDDLQRQVHPGPAPEQPVRERGSEPQSRGADQAAVAGRDAELEPGDRGGGRVRNAARGAEGLGRDVMAFDASDSTVVKGIKSLSW